MQHEQTRPEESAPQKPKVLRASEAVSLALRRLISESGESVAVERLGMARQTLARLVAELSVNPSTLIVASQRLGVDLRGTLADAGPDDSEIEG